MCEQRDYLITPDPAHKVEPWARVRAVNALDALNKYGLWGVFTNATIWAIPISDQV
jgi:hypothetical protein